MTPRLALVPIALLTISCASHRASVPAAPLQAGPSFLDLRLGVRLTIEKAYYAKGSSGKGLDGYLGTRTAKFRVNTKGNLELLSEEAKQFREGPAFQIPPENLLPAAATNKPFYRFVYQVPFARAGRPTSPVLLGAKSSREIEELSARLKKDPAKLCTARSTMCTAFPENSTASISMEIMVNEIPKVVIWGTVLSSVTEGKPAKVVNRLTEGKWRQLTVNGGSLAMPLLPMDEIRF